MQDETRQDTLPSALSLEIGQVVRTKRIEVAFDGEGGLISGNFSAGRGKRFIIALLGTTVEAGEISIEALLDSLGWQRKSTPDTAKPPIRNSRSDG